MWAVVRPRFVILNLVVFGTKPAFVRRTDNHSHSVFRVASRGYSKIIMSMQVVLSGACLSCLDNPVTEIDDYRMEVLIRVPQLDTLDKEEFVIEDKQEALALYEERKEEFDLEMEDGVAEEEVYRRLLNLIRLFN